MSSSLLLQLGAVALGVDAMASLLGYASGMPTNPSYLFFFGAALILASIASSLITIAEKK